MRRERQLPRHIRSPCSIGRMTICAWDWSTGTSGILMATPSLLHYGSSTRFNTALKERRKEIEYVHERHINRFDSHYLYRVNLRISAWNGGQFRPSFETAQ